MPDGDPSRDTSSRPARPFPTRRRGLRDFFYAKLHRHQGSKDAQWRPDLDPADEFAIFDEADFLDLSDDKGDLFGLRRDPIDGVFDVIGTRGEQVAEFPIAPPNQAWHGYPCWPLRRHGDGVRKAQPPREALDKMVASGVITPKQRSRLAGGKPI
jgi:hypothetical protein